MITIKSKRRVDMDHASKVPAQQQMAQQACMTAGKALGGQVNHNDNYNVAGGETACCNTAPAAARKTGGKPHLRIY
jgi:NaMN:DMB phosphoribosyltransferase